MATRAASLRGLKELRGLGLEEEGTVDRCMRSDVHVGGSQMHCRPI